MTKNFKAVKASILTGIVLISVLFAVLPTASAGLFINLQSALTVNWSGNQTNIPIVPRGDLRNLDLEITHWVTRGALGRGMLLFYSGAPVTITVRIIETPSWVTATLSQGSLQTQVVPDGESKLFTKISMQVSDDAPAYAQGYIKLEATANKAGFIKGFTQEFTLTFLPDYKPLIKAEYPETNTMQIGPLDTAVFPIKVTNLGNAKTVVKFAIKSVPEDWNAIINEELLLDEGNGSYNIAYLVIKPPKNFGYHNDQRTITITMQPVKYDDRDKKGDITDSSFLVESRGFSTPGFESIAFIGALAAAFLIIAFFKKRK
jgi:hypothetical protein